MLLLILINKKIVARFDEITAQIKKVYLNFINPEELIKDVAENSEEYQKIYQSIYKEFDKNFLIDNYIKKSFAIEATRKNLIMKQLSKNPKDNIYVNKFKESLQKSELKVIECEVMKGWSFAIKVTLEDGYTFFVKKDNFVQNNNKHLPFVLGYKMLRGLGIGSKFDWKQENDGGIVFITQDLGYSKNAGNEREFSEKLDKKMPEGEKNKLEFFGKVLIMSDVKIEYSKADRKNCGVVTKKDKPNAAKIIDFNIIDEGSSLNPDVKKIKQDHLLNSTKYNKTGNFISKQDRARLQDKEKASFIKLLEVQFKNTLREYDSSISDESLNTLWRSNDPAKWKDKNIKELVEYKNKALQNYADTLLECPQVENAYNKLKNEKGTAASLGSRFNIMEYFKDTAYKNDISKTNFTERKSFIEKNFDQYAATKSFLEHAKNRKISEKQITQLKKIINGQDATGNTSTLKLTDIFPKSSRILALYNDMVKEASWRGKLDEARLNESVKQLAAKILATQGIGFNNCYYDDTKKFPKIEANIDMSR